MHCTIRTLLGSAFAPLARTPSPSLPAFFLIPAFALRTSSSSFSTTTPVSARKRDRKRDRNPARGVSALKRTGLQKQKLFSITVKDLPKPNLNPSKRSAVEVDEEHGLWEFMTSDRRSMPTPEELDAHGRAWSVEELRHKDWEDLHKLWWVCLKELNRLATWTAERKRVGDVFGDYESDERKRVVQDTMRNIKKVLKERWYAWENAREAAMLDDEVNLYADTSAGESGYVPKDDHLESEESAQSIPAPDAASPEVVRV